MKLCIVLLVALCGVTIGVGDRLGRVIRDPGFDDPAAASALVQDILKVGGTITDSFVVNTPSLKRRNNVVNVVKRRRRPLTKRLNHLVNNVANSDHLERLLSGTAVQKATTNLVSKLESLPPTTVDITGMLGQLKGMVAWLQSHFSPSEETLQLFATSLQDYDHVLSPTQKERIVRMINVVRGVVHLATSPQVTAYLRSLVEPDVIVGVIVRLHAQGLGFLKTVEHEMTSAPLRNEL